MNDILRHIVSAFLMWLPWGFAAASEAGPSCGDCYHIDTTTLISVVIGDVFLTVVIILVVYYCTKQSFQKKHNDDDRKVYMNMPIR